jgi:hypothetical protein
MPYSPGSVGAGEHRVAGRNPGSEPPPLACVAGGGFHVPLATAFASRLYHVYLPVTRCNGFRNTGDVAWSQSRTVLGAGMAKYPRNVDDLAWVEVSVAQPCRICGAVRECLMRASGEFADCHQVTSDWPMTDGGWLHRLDTMTVLDRSELVATV